MTRLYRSRTNKRITGLCGGIGQYLNIDPLWIRLVFAIGIFWGWPVVILYIVGSLIIPMPDSEVLTDTPEGEASGSVKGRAGNNAALIGGTLMILLGAYFLADNLPFLQGFTEWIDDVWDVMFFPALFLIPGIILVAKGVNRKKEETA